MNDSLFIELITKAIRDINSDPSLTAEEKAKAVKQLGGAPKQALYDYLNVTYRTGPDIAKNIQVLIDPQRPRGGPSTTKPGTTLDSIKEKIKRINRPKKD